MFIKYRVAGTSEYLVIRGRGIEGIKICKKALIWPFQKYFYIDMLPFNYSYRMDITSADMLEFTVSIDYTIGPIVDDEDALIRYAKFRSKRRLGVMDCVIVNETRSVAASMTMEEIFMRIQDFKRGVINNLDREFSPFGFQVYNVHVLDRPCVARRCDYSAQPGKPSSDNKFKYF
ncbi:Flotillin family [Trema orientale]|uniref:Flotillin-like n=1 Tax=Trema orientale TaxID=63057 RepID=A0A2P5BKG4_TREOI|nr:Flotillin family [Trema orientale]